MEAARLSRQCLLSTSRYSCPLTTGREEYRLTLLGSTTATFPRPSFAANLLATAEPAVPPPSTSSLYESWLLRRSVVENCRRGSDDCDGEDSAATTSCFEQWLQRRTSLAAVISPDKAMSSTVGGRGTTVTM